MITIANHVGKIAELSLDVFCVGRGASTGRESRVDSGRGWEVLKVSEKPQKMSRGTQRNRLQLPKILLFLKGRTRSAGLHSNRFPRKLVCSFHLAMRPSWKALFGTLWHEEGH